MANSISHAALPYPIKNARFTVQVPYLDADGDPTDPTTPDTELSQDGGAFADAAEEMTTISGSNGVGYITLTGAETNNSSVAGAAKVASGPKATLFTLYPRVLAVVGSGTLSAGSAGGGTLGTILAYDVTGCFIRTTGGTGGGGTGGANNQARKIATYTPSTGAFTVVPDWETQPDNTTTYDILLPEGVTLGMLRTLNPTTAGRTLDVSSGGEAGLDWANIGSPTTTVNLSGTTVGIVALLNALAANSLTASATAADLLTEIRTFLHGGDWAADMDSNGRHRIVDGTGAGELETLSGTVLLRSANEQVLADWIDGGRLDLILDSRASQTSVNTIDDLLDTEIGSLTTELAKVPKATGWLYFDSVNGSSGTTEGIATDPRQPSNTLADLITLAASTKIRRVMVTAGSTVTLSGTVDDLEFYGHNYTLALNGASVGQIKATGATITGTTATGGGTIIDAFDCSFHSTFAPGGGDTIYGVRCKLFDDWDLDGNTVHLTHCQAYDFTLTYRSGNQNLSNVYLWDCALENLSVQGMTAADGGDTLVVQGGSGDITFEASCTGSGGIELHGLWSRTNTAGITITDHCTSLTDAIPSSNTTGSINERLKTMDDADMPSRLPAALISGRMDATVGAMQSNVITAASTASDYLTELRTSLLGGDWALSTNSLGMVRVADGTSTGEIDTDSGLVRLSAAGVDDIFDEIVEGAVTFRKSMRLANAANAGKTSGGGTSNFLIRDLQDSLDRIDATVDADGNRLAVATNLN